MLPTQFCHKSPLPAPLVLRMTWDPHGRIQGRGRQMIWHHIIVQHRFWHETRNDILVLGWYSRIQSKFWFHIRCDVTHWQNAELPPISHYCHVRQWQGTWIVAFLVVLGWVGTAVPFAWHSRKAAVLCEHAIFLSLPFALWAVGRFRKTFYSFREGLLLNFKRLLTGLLLWLASLMWKFGFYFHTLRSASISGRRGMLFVNSSFHCRPWTCCSWGSPVSSISESSRVAWGGGASKFHSVDRMPSISRNWPLDPTPWKCYIIKDVYCIFKKHNAKNTKLLTPAIKRGRAKLFTKNWIT